MTITFRLGVIISMWCCFHMYALECPLPIVVCYMDSKWAWIAISIIIKFQWCVPYAVLIGITFNIIFNSISVQKSGWCVAAWCAFLSFIGLGSIILKHCFFIFCVCFFFLLSIQFESLFFSMFSVRSCIMHSRNWTMQQRTTHAYRSLSTICSDNWFSCFSEV